MKTTKSKTASATTTAVDDSFDRDLRQIVGADSAPESAPDWQRPDVGISGSANDAIDEYFLSWMRGRDAEDRVVTAPVTKSASLTSKIEKAFASDPTSQRAVIENLRRLLGREKLKSLGTGALAGGGLTAGAGALYVKGRRDQRRRFKTAGVIENAENLDLLSRVRARAAAAMQHGQAVTSDA